MSVKRIRDISLSWVAPGWQDSKILVVTRGFEDTIRVHKEQNKFDNQITKLDRELRKLQRQTDEIFDETELEAHYAQIDKLEDQTNKLAIGRLEYLQDEVTKRFENGQIYDYDLKETRAMVKEDIKELDLEIITKISQVIFGQLGNV